LELSGEVDGPGILRVVFTDSALSAGTGAVEMVGVDSTDPGSPEAEPLDDKAEE
jgi:hypothetical protein